MAWIDTDKSGWTMPAQTRYCWTLIHMLFIIFRYWCIFYIVYVQSRDATCEEYSRADSSTGSSVTPEIEDVTSLIPLQKSCESDGEAVPFFLCWCKVQCNRLYAVFYHNYRFEFWIKNSFWHKKKKVWKWLLCIFFQMRPNVKYLRLVIMVI